MDDCSIDFEIPIEWDESSGNDKPSCVQMVAKVCTASAPVISGARSETLDALCEMAKEEGWHRDDTRETLVRATSWALRGLVRRGLATRLDNDR